MTKGIFGSPRLRGNSEIIVGAIYEKIADAAQDAAQIALFVGGAAVTRKTSATSQNINVVKFNSLSFEGFAVCNDHGKKSRTLSVVKAGLNIPVPLATGKTVAVGDAVGLTAEGAVIKNDDADCVYLLNAEVSEIGVNAYDANNVVHANQVAINLGLGGGVKPAH